MASQKLERLLSFAERDFLLGALREEKRIDGRKPFDFRTIKIAFGEHPGQVEVLLGQTRVLTNITCKLTEPFPDRPTDGFFQFNTEFSPMASPVFEVGRQSEFAVELGRVVERGLRESKAIDSEELCIIAGKKVWSVRIDIHILDHAGNLLDCACIATITALLHFRRPEVSVVGDEVVVHSPKDRQPVSLSIHHIPISVTFAFFAEGELVAVDPSLKEELAMDGRMTITMNSHREICAVQKAGGTPIPVSRILQCSKIAAVKVAEITDVIQRSLKDVKLHSLFVKPAELSALAPVQVPALPALSAQSFVSQAEAFAVAHGSTWRPPSPTDDPMTIDQEEKPPQKKQKAQQMADQFLADMSPPKAASPASSSASPKGSEKKAKKTPKPPADSESEEEPVQLLAAPPAKTAAPKVKTAAAAAPPVTDLAAALKKKKKPAAKPKPKK